MLSIASTGFGTVTDPTFITGTLSVTGVPGRPETAGLHPVKKYTSVCWMVSYRENDAAKIASAMRPASA